MRPCCRSRLLRWRPLCAHLFLVAQLLLIDITTATVEARMRLVRAPSYDELLIEYRKLAGSANYTLRVDWDVLTDRSGSYAPKPPPTAAKTSPGSLVYECLNSASQQGQSISWDSVTSGTVQGSVRIAAGVWHQGAPPVPLTVVTFGTADRLNQLYAQCRHWPGPLSIVVYEPLLQSSVATGLQPASRERLRHALMRVLRIVTELSVIPNACQLNLLLAYETIKEPAAMILTPINTLRNYARIQARTPLMAILEADLLTSKSLYQRIEKTADTLQLQASKKQVFIIPAFDLEPQYKTSDWAQAFASLDLKAFLVTAVNEGVVSPFRIKTFAAGHRLTDFPRWLTAKGDYEVKYESWCEPWVLGSRTLLEWHDERYRGYGANKVQHLLGLNQTGYKFKVLHDAFIIHRPHKETSVKAMYRKGVKPAGVSVSLAEYVHNLFQQQSDQAQAGQPYEAVTGRPVAACLTALPWWRVKP